MQKKLGVGAPELEFQTHLWTSTLVIYSESKSRPLQNDKILASDLRNAEEVKVGAPELEFQTYFWTSTFVVYIELQIRPL